MRYYLRIIRINNVSSFDKNSVMFIFFTEEPTPKPPKMAELTRTGFPLARKQSMDATKEESIKELTSKLEEVASQHAEKVIKSRPPSGKRSSGDESIDLVKADMDPKGKQ